MAEANQQIIEPPLVVEVAGYPGGLEFRTIDELQRFATEELDAWDWAAPRNISGLSEPLASKAQNFINNVVKLKQLTDLAVIKGLQDGNILPQLHSTFNLFANRQLIYSRSPDGVLLKRIAETDGAKVALGAIAAFGPAYRLEDWPTVIQGISRLVELRVDRDGALSAAATALTALQAQWSQRLDEQEELFADTVRKLDHRMRQMEGERQRARQFLSHQISKTRTFFSDAREQKDALEAAFREHMRLKGPVHYWSSKASSHHRWFIGAFICFALVMGGGAYGLFHNSPWVLDVLKQDKTQGVSLSGLALITLPALGFFWVLRFIARVFVTNLQRQQDAAERATMVETYLALIAEGKGAATDQERILVLNALFRPGPGDANDDAPSPQLMDFILGKQMGPK